MNRTKRLLTLLLLVCGMTTGAWAQSSDVLSGGFTINASGTTVQFSKGNLQYINGNWQFAEHQYDYIGDNQSDNNKDLFAFNGYSTPDVSWFNMSHDQWKYLLATRSVTNSLYAGARYTMATLGGTYKGLIIFPDNYTHPDGTDFVAGTYNDCSNFTATVSLAGWALMEAAGCVFLPAAGYYSAPNEVFGGFGGAVEINTTTSYNSNDYYTPAFKENLAGYDAPSDKNSRMSVRLVQLKTDLQQDADGYYLIGTVQDWKNFAAIVNGGITNINAKMTADIDLGSDQTKIGSSSTYYSGIFDGQGHTLTVNWTTTGDYCAPFPYINGATFKNLHVTGTINTSHRFTGGLIGKPIGTSYINNCRSSVEMISSYSGDAVRGGFAASVEGSTLNFNDCIFDGKFEGASSQTWGGFVGWKYSGSVNIQNGLFVPKSVNVSATYSATFSGNGGTVTNSYYIVQINNSTQGTKATAEQLADGTITYKLQNNREDLVWGQRIGTDAEPVLTNDESYRVYRSINGGYTNDPAEANGCLQQDADGNYLIGSVLDWQDFAALVNGGITNINARMTADIDLGDDQTTVGTMETPFQGVFDGQGHTLTIDFTPAEERFGLFRFISGATIRNLNVTGTINTTYRMVGSLVGRTDGGINNITNCRSSVDINSTTNEGHQTGGLVGRVSADVTLNISDCVFDGSIVGQSSSNYCGGIVGYNVGTLNMSNCLFMPETAEIGSSYTSTLVQDGGTTNISNCYYTTAMGTVQGTLATTITLSNGTITAALQNGREDLVWGQRIGTDAEPVLTNDESYRVYRSINGGYTNDPTLAYEGLQKDVNDNYLLGCVWDWKEFAALVNSGTNNTANAKMTADINLGDDQTHIGSMTQEQGPFYSGTFDGQGHTLTIAYDDRSGNKIIAPFTQIRNATIKNLKVAGSIYSTFAFIGVVGYVNGGGNSYISNIWSTASFTCVHSGWKHTSGIVGSVGNGATANISDCLVTGSVSASDHSGPFVGLIYGGTAYISNCLSTGMLNVSSYTTETTTNSYVKGYSAEVTDESLADGTVSTALQNSREETVWVQDPLTNLPMLALFAKAAYTVPSSGLGTFSAKAKFALPEGLEAYYCTDYADGKISVVGIEGAVPAETGILLRGTPGETYTLTGTNSDSATVTDNALVAVVEPTHVNQIEGDYTNFMMSGGKFVKIAASNDPDMKMPANRAYLRILTSKLSELPSGAPITIMWGGEPTNIDALDSRPSTLDQAQPMYNIAGQRVSDSYKGIVIVNGQKYVRK